VTHIDYVVDPTSNLAIVRPSAGLFAPKMTGVGSITYRCHSCSELIPKQWEVLFWDPAGDWLGYILPPVMPATMTTHHDWHMELTQED
jgi:hypothetical protein